MKSGSEEAPQLIFPCDKDHGNTWLCIFAVECIFLSGFSTLRTLARKKLFNKGQGIEDDDDDDVKREGDAHRNGVTERAASSSHLSTSAWPTQSGTFSGGNIAVLLDFFQIASPPSPSQPGQVTDKADTKRVQNFFFLWKDARDFWWLTFLGDSHTNTKNTTGEIFGNY